VASAAVTLLGYALTWIGTATLAVLLMVSAHVSWRTHVVLTLVGCAGICVGLGLVF